MTKTQAVLNVLRRAEGGWISLAELMLESGSGAVHSVIASLRKRGHRIENHTVHDRRGLVARSSYRLVRPEWESPPPPGEKEAPAAAQHTGAEGDQPPGGGEQIALSLPEAIPASTPPWPD